MLTTLIAFALITKPSAPLTPSVTVKLSKPGRFDYMTVDQRYARLFATHGGASTLSVISLATGQTKEIDTGGVVNGVQVDQQLERVFVAGGGKKLIALDRKSLDILHQVDLDGPGDDIAIDDKRQQIYVCHDDGDNTWVFDARTLKKIGDVKLSGIPEYLEYDRKTDRLYQNIKDKNQLQVIDPVKKAVVKSWDTGAEKLPHGLALDRKTMKAFSAGGNGKLTVFDYKTGRSLAILDIVQRTDQIAFDEGLKRVYCCGAGAITVLQETATGAKSLGDVACPRGAHTIAVDQRTHEVYVCYANDSGAFIQGFRVPVALKHG